jgi:predicted dehydrogenase
MIKVGFIGNGFAKFLIEPLKSIPGVEVTAICAKDEKKLIETSEQYKIPRYYTDYKEMLKSPEVNTIVVSTPPSLHFQEAYDSINAGMDVLIEKPATTNISDFLQLQKIAEGTGAKVAVNHMMRFNKIYSIIKSLKQSELLGKISKIEFNNSAGTLPDTHWFWDRNISGGIFIEHGVHFFDIYNSIFGKPKVLYSKKYFRDPAQKIQDRVSVQLEYPEEVLASFTHMFDQVVGHEITYSYIHSTSGWLKVEGWNAYKLSGNLVIESEKIEELKTILGSDTQIEVVPFIVNPDRFQESPKNPLQVEFSLQLAPFEINVYKDNVQSLLQNFVDSINNNTAPLTNLNEIESGLKTAIEAQASER